MKRFGLVMAAAALVGAVNTAEAQLSMHMGNGWSATFAGNVNAFYIYSETKSEIGGTSSAIGKSNGISTGLLPAFFTFEAKGKEGNTDLGVHFGFAPGVSYGGNVSSFFGTQAAGAQIDMRQVYATVGGTWGTILFGKELGIFQRQNILQDMTLFGVGAQGVIGLESGINAPNRATTLGRIGYGYLYTDFRGQFSYSTPAGKPFSLTFGVSEPISVSPYDYPDTPRFEAELTYKPKLSEKSNLLLFASGAYGHAKTNCCADNTGGLSSVGFSGGAKFDVSGFSLTGSGFYAEGMGSIFMGDAFLGNGKTGVDGALPDGTKVKTYGWYAQGMYSLPNGKFSFGASYGGNYVSDAAPGDFKNRTAMVGQATYHVTKSSRVVAEYVYFESKYQDTSDKAKANQFALGMMLFY